MARWPKGHQATPDLKSLVLVQVSPVLVQASPALEQALLAWATPVDASTSLGYVDLTYWVCAAPDLEVPMGF